MKPKHIKALIRKVFDEHEIKFIEEDHEKGFSISILKNGISIYDVGASSKKQAYAGIVMTCLWKYLKDL